MPISLASLQQCPSTKVGVKCFMPHLSSSSWYLPLLARVLWFGSWGGANYSNPTPIQLPSGLEWSTHHFGPPKDGDVSSDLNSWILFLGLFGIVHIFFMQVEEEERVHIYLKVLNNSESALVFCLKFAKAVMPILLRIAGIHTLFCSSGNLELVLSCTALMFSSSTLRSLVSKSSFWAFAGYVCSRRTCASTTSKTCECEGKGCRQMLGCDHRRPCPTIIDIIEIRFPSFSPFILCSHVFPNHGNPCSTLAKSWKIQAIAHCSLVSSGRQLMVIENMWTHVNIR